MTGRLLGGERWPELTGRRPLIALPLGSCEQHGPHLPLDTDTRIAVELAGRLADATGARGTPRADVHMDFDVLVAAPLPIGASWEHHGFPGLLSITSALLADALVEIARSADWARGLVLVNGHGGNHAGVADAVSRITDEGRAVLSWWPRVEGGDAHAGRTETSIMLALAPEAVRLEDARSGYAGSASAAFSAGLRVMSPTGIVGDPTGASADEGFALLDALAADLIASVSGWARPR